MAKEDRFIIQKFESKLASNVQVLDGLYKFKYEIRDGLGEVKDMTNGSDTSRTQLHLSHSAKQRLKWMEHFRKYRNARLTCRHFGISPDTFYLWRKRFNPDNLLTLEDDMKSRRPLKLRSSKHLLSQLETVKKLKEVNPKIGKVRITKILKELGYSISPSTIFRILSALKKQI